MVFFGEKDPEFVEKAISMARAQLCKKLNITVEGLKAKTVEIRVDESIVTPWTIYFVTTDEMEYEVRIDPANLM